ncbi:GNAT family N-acetyltransferase [Vibrio viridaestus]|uniref:N-acetyltransferase n=1 Tax=Vibrio viridaestus TaxID=2487322 RepID=A0A3N9TJG4_9VIBR|nr:GNAT family N-acetyltransferase [Vibrio viridaestus]RQW64301.1 N-acetyltransferase [Vibrio viridaestus]
MKIRAVQSDDIDSLTQIYNRYIEETTITFEEAPVNAEIMAERVTKTLDSGMPWVVAEADGNVIGYAYAHFWHERSAYRFTVEPSIYLSQECTGKGVGRAIYTDLLNRLREKGIKQVLGVIALPNPASIGLHESLGFKKTGELENVGYKFDCWLSIGFWQLEL